MPKQVIGRVIKPPKGWTFSGNELVPEEVFSEETFSALYSWAKGKGYGLTPNLTEGWYQNGYTISCRYTVHTESWDVTVKWLGNGTWLSRPGPSGKNVSLGKYEYIAQNGIAYYNSCAHCMRVGIKTSWVGPRGSTSRICAACTKACVSCQGEIFQGAGWAGDGMDKCLECCPRTKCVSCRQYHPTTDVTENPNGRKYCGTCAAARTCAECHVVSDHNLQKLTGGKALCPLCIGKAIEAERLPHEKWTEGELPVGGSLVIESLSNRPVRVISIETEVDGDAQAIANTLYNEGVVREAYVESYGTQCPDGSTWPAFLKYDGSVTGGELINFLLQLDKKEHADSLLNVLSKVRSLEKTKKVKYTETCGGHIHIDAHNFSTDNVWRLLTGYNYVEDVIFRLAGAGHKFGHRTLVPGHDRANHGAGYSHPTAKGPWGVKSNAYRALASQNRMTGLNFQPYVGAVSYCECGAGADNLRACKCKLHKCTIEWRVWNSTGNPRILHAWIAFMQSLHAWADSAKEMTEPEEKEYPPLAWTKLDWRSTTPAHKVLAQERVKWIFSNLVFTDSEKDSLIYAFQQSDFLPTHDFWDMVREIPTPRNRTVKAPRNCFIRPKTMKVQLPEKKVFGNPNADPDYIRARDRQARFQPQEFIQRAVGGRRIR